VQVEIDPLGSIMTSWGGEVAQRTGSGAEGLMLDVGDRKAPLRVAVENGRMEVTSDILSAALLVGAILNSS
jgi:hypothetical protein